MGIPTDEQETTIGYERTGKYLFIYTSDSTQMTLLDKKVSNYPESWQLIEVIKDQSGNVVAKKYRASKNLLTLRNEKSKRSGNPNAGEALKRWRESQKEQRGI